MAKEISRTICTIEYTVNHKGVEEQKTLTLGETIPTSEKVMEFIAKTFTKVMLLTAKITSCVAHLRKYSMATETFIKYAEKVDDIDTQVIE